MESVDIQEKPVGPLGADLDWHPADVVAALWKARTTLRRLSRQNRYAPDSLKLALRHPWPRAESIIATAIGTAPQQIWPSRYHADGTPKSGRGERGLGRGAQRLQRDRRNRTKHSTGGAAVNVHAVDVRRGGQA